MPILRPRRKPRRPYPNADRFEEDGRRIYSAYTSSNRPRRRQYKVIAIAVPILVTFALVTGGAIFVL